MRFSSIIRLCVRELQRVPKGDPDSALLVAHWVMGARAPKGAKDFALLVAH